jgi:hypothetical protein
MMARETYIPSKGDKIDVRRIFREIREAVQKATSRKELIELYKHAGYMITLTHATPINEKSGGEVKIERGVTEREFARAVRQINKQAKKIGTEPDFNETWEELATNGYESEDDTLLEPQNVEK